MKLWKAGAWACVFDNGVNVFTTGQFGLGNIVDIAMTGLACNPAFAPITLAYMGYDHYYQHTHICQPPEKGDLGDYIYYTRIKRVCETLIMNYEKICFNIVAFAAMYLFLCTNEKRYDV